MLFVVCSMFVFVYFLFNLLSSQFLAFLSLFFSFPFVCVRHLESVDQSHHVLELTIENVQIDSKHCVKDVFVSLE